MALFDFLVHVSNIQVNQWGGVSVMDGSMENLKKPPIPLLFSHSLLPALLEIFNIVRLKVLKVR